MKVVLPKHKDFSPKLKVSEIVMFLKLQNRWKKAWINIRLPVKYHSWSGSPQALVRGSWDDVCGFEWSGYLFTGHNPWNVSHVGQEVGAHPVANWTEAVVVQ